MYTDAIHNPWIIGWLACGVVGAAIGCIRQPNKMKKMEPFIILIALVAGVAMGPFTLYSAFTSDKDDEQ